MMIPGTIPQHLTSPRLLIVEGKDECNFFASLTERLSIRDLQIINAGGSKKFPKQFEALQKMAEFHNLTTIGIVRDAEENPAMSAFASACDTLGKFGLPVPVAPGQINSTQNPSVGIFIMPDNASPGMLEDLCLNTLRGADIERCIQQYISCFSPGQLLEEKPFFNSAKARVQAYLASRAPIVNSLGLAALSNFWDLNHACFTNINSFLTTLFT
jgi:hypothetical protein